MMPQTHLLTSQSDSFFSELSAELVVKIFQKTPADALYTNCRVLNKHYKTIAELVILKGKDDISRQVQKKLIHNYATCPSLDIRPEDVRSFYSVLFDLLGSDDFSKNNKLEILMVLGRLTATKISLKDNFCQDLLTRFDIRHGLPVDQFNFLSHAAPFVNAEYLIQFLKIVFDFLGEPYRPLRKKTIACLEAMKRRVKDDQNAATYLRSWLQTELAKTEKQTLHAPLTCLTYAPEFSNDKLYEQVVHLLQHTSSEIQINAIDCLAIISKDRSETELFQLAKQLLPFLKSESYSCSEAAAKCLIGFMSQLKQENLNTLAQKISPHGLNITHSSHLPQWLSNGVKFLYQYLNKEKTAVKVVRIHLLTLYTLRANKEKKIGKLIDYMANQLAEESSPLARMGIYGCLTDMSIHKSKAIKLQIQNVFTAELNNPKNTELSCLKYLNSLSAKIALPLDKKLMDSLVNKFLDAQELIRAKVLHLCVVNRIYTGLKIQEQHYLITCITKELELNIDLANKEVIDMLGMYFYALNIDDQMEVIRLFIRIFNIFNETDLSISKAIILELTQLAPVIDASIIELLEKSNFFNCTNVNPILLKDFLYCVNEYVSQLQNKTVIQNLLVSLRQYLAGNDGSLVKAASSCLAKLSLPVDQIAIIFTPFIEKLTKNESEANFVLAVLTKQSFFLKTHTAFLLEIIKNKLKDEHYDVRVTALNCMSRLMDHIQIEQMNALIPEIIQQLHNHPSESWHCLSKIVHLAYPKVVQELITQLIPFLDDQNVNIRKEVMRHLFSALALHPKVNLTISIDENSSLEKLIMSFYYENLQQIVLSFEAEECRSKVQLA